MRFVLYTNSVSAHQLPLARELIVRVGVDNFHYIYTGDTLQGGNQEVATQELWITREKTGRESGATTDWLEDCDILLAGGLRPFGLFERRSKKGLKTFYQSERWFKPVKLFDLRLFDFLIEAHLPGWVRMLHPRYFLMARRFVKIVKSDPNFRILPIGPHAMLDFLRLGIHKPKMMDWGYFVQSGMGMRARTARTAGPIRILWVGRMLALKRVDTIIRAVRALDPSAFSLTVLGTGPMRAQLVKMAAGAENIVFKDAVPIGEVRELMRTHDVYVFSSNGEDGWGAVVSEALEEGMTVFGTYETGAPAALLPESRLFHCGDWRTLARKLSGLQLPLAPVPIPHDYTARGAAERLLECCK